MDGWYERIVPVLENYLRESWSETLGWCVDVEEHFVAPPPPHQPNCVYVNVQHEECHGLTCVHGEQAKLFGHESDLCSCDFYGSVDILGDFGTSNQCPLILVENYGQGCVALWRQRYATRRRIAAFSHAMGCPVVPWTINLPLTLLLLSVKRILFTRRRLGGLRLWLGLAGFQQIIVCLIAGKVSTPCQFRLCITHLHLVTGGRRMWSRWGQQRLVSVQSLLGRCIWGCGGWILGGDGLLREKNLLSCMTQSVGPDKSWWIPLCWIRGMGPPRMQRFGPCSRFVAPRFFYEQSFSQPQVILYVPCDRIFKEGYEVLDQLEVGWDL